MISVLFYPFVFVFPMIGLTGGSGATAVEVSYTGAGIVANAVFVVVIQTIAVGKSQADISAASWGAVAA